MKTFLRKTVLAAALLLAATSPALQANAENNKPVYKKTHNPSIGVTVENATGAAYVIKDQDGNVVLKGTVKSGKTFYISTGKLGKGIYRFVIGSLVLQEFVIQ